MLETMPALTHHHCMHEIEIPDFRGHASVTEVELCEDYYGAWDSAQPEPDYEAEIAAENAWLHYAEGGWDPTGSYAAESLLTAGGQIAYS